MGKLEELKQQTLQKKKRGLPATEGIAELKKVTSIDSRTNILPKQNKCNRSEIGASDRHVDILPQQGYHIIGKNQQEQLEALITAIREAGICSLDYESDADIDDDTVDPQDHNMVMLSVSYKVGLAFCIPVAMTSYAANFEVDWIVDNFLRPILEDPKIIIVAHNIKFEHGHSLLYGINMLPKAFRGMVMDTMLMVKAVALPQNTEMMGEGYEVRVGLKPATKALLADSQGMVHNLLHIDAIKSFSETVGKVSWEEETEDYYRSGSKQGLPKTIKRSRSRRFNELPVDKEVIDYSCSDADWALGLYYYLLPYAEETGVLDVLKELDVPFMMSLAEYELAGWHIDKVALADMGRIADEALGRIEPELYGGLLQVTNGYADTEDGNVMVPAGSYSMGDYRGEPTFLEIKTTKPFSWGSVQHLQWLFFYVLKISTTGIARSKSTGLPTTGKEAIDELITRATQTSDNKFISALKEKRKYDKIKSTYVGSYDPNTDTYSGGLLQYCRRDTDKIHTNLNLVSTWRLASKKPNLQNIPRADNDPLGIRGVFVAPSYDIATDYSGLRSPYTRPSSIIIQKKLSGETMWVGADYSQIELKVLAWYAAESSMIKTLASGGDLHSSTAKDVFKLDCSVEDVKKLYKPFRYRAKKVNFGLVYGMTEYGLSSDPQMNMSVEEAKAFIEQYMRTYPGVRNYEHTMIALARKLGYVETMFGHRRPLPDINHPNVWVRKAAENKAMNTPIQGSASDIIRLAMVNIRKEAPSWLKPVIQIHDEIICECPVEFAGEGARIIKEIMERPIEGFTDIMPIVAEPSVGKIWRHALDVSWDNGRPYVKPKKERKEATDVTYEDMAYAKDLYKMAGIEVR